MSLSYEDLISGDPIFVQGIGHLKSPNLWQLKPTKGIGMWKYNLYLNVLVWDKSAFLKFIRTTRGRASEKLQDDRLNVFDIVTLLEYTRELVHNSLKFFMVESLLWDEKSRCFVVQTEDGKEIGRINRDNFDTVRSLMLQLNYINVGESAQPTKHSSKKAQELWERAQKYLKEETAKSPQDKRLALGNIISKLCAASTSYNLLNIYDLTVFQLYDQFFQYGYLRAMNLNEMAFSNHGGKDFDMQAWLKPIIKF